MKSRILAVIVTLAILVHCRSVQQQIGSESQSLFNTQVFELILMLVNYQETENNWPNSVGELESTFGNDSAMYYLRNCRRFEITASIDTLYANFEIEVDSTQIVTGLFKFKDLNDSIFLNLNLASSSGVRLKENSYISLTDGALYMSKAD